MSNLDIKKLKKIVKNKYDKIFILTGKNSYEKSGAKKIFKEILKEKKTTFYFKKKAIPEYKELLKITDKFDNNIPELFIAIGGGVVMDYAKIVNILHNKINLKKKIKNYSYKYGKKKSKLIAIPTTAGSGAEVTSNAVIYINKIKYSFENQLLIPDNYCLESDFVKNNPKKIKASSGFDAIAQAIESIFSLKGNEQSYNYAKNSLKLSIQNYLKYLDRPSIYNSKKMILASNLAGKAINISKTIAPHAISYPFSSKFGIDHGHAVSLNFEKFIKFNYLNSFRSEKIEHKKKYQTLFRLTKTKNINEFYNWIRYLKRKAGLESRYSHLKINMKKEFNSIIEGVNLLRLKNNPVELSKEDIKNIII